MHSDSSFNFFFAVSVFFFLSLNLFPSFFSLLQGFLKHFCILTLTLNWMALQYVFLHNQNSFTFFVSYFFFFSCWPWFLNLPSFKTSALERPFWSEHCLWFPFHEIRCAILEPFPPSSFLSLSISFSPTPLLTFVSQSARFSSSFFFSFILNFRTSFMYRIYQFLLFLSPWVFYRSNLDREMVLSSFVVRKGCRVRLPNGQDKRALRMGWAA